MKESKEKVIVVPNIKYAVFSSNREDLEDYLIV